MIDGMPVLDAVVHAYNFDASNFANRHAGIVGEIVYGAVGAMSSPGYVPSREAYFRDWSIEETADLVFAESDTDLATYHVLPLNAFRDGLCSFEKAVEAQERWPNRFVVYCGVDPMQGEAALEELERQIEVLRPVGLKLYPSSWVGEEVRGWKMDDPEIAFPLFERAQQLGVKVVAIHKAVPLGPLPLEHYRVDDVDRAAMAFPGLNFEVVHGGMAFLEETAWQLARFPNVYVNLEITTALAATRPLAFQQALASLVGPGGEPAYDRILWGTGAMAFHPQPLLEAFVRDIEIPAALVEGAGIPPLTREVKQKILFDNYARMTGLDLHARLELVADDGFARRKGDSLLSPYSTAQVPAGV